MLGDSFAYGLGVERQHGYADVLEQLLARTQVVNLAVAGYATDQEVLLFEREYPRWQPHAVILLMYGNDLIHNTQRTVYTHYTKPKFAIVDDQLQLRFAPRARPGIDTRLNHWLATRSAAYYRLQFLYATAKTPPVPFFRSRALGILGRLTGDMPVDRLEDYPSTGRAPS